MEGAAVDEDALFSTIEASGARALLIGRRAMIVLGIPVMTANCDLWLHVDDVERLNAAMEAIDHHPSVPADEARRRRRYVIGNDEHIDVMVARSATT